MPLEFLFVYGTLRRQIASSMQHVLADYCEYYSDGVMRGKLYEVLGYPGALESCNANDKVFGELHRILDRQRVLARLDDYEECSNKFPRPHEYIRKQLSVEFVGGGTTPAWVYLYNRDVSNLRQIVSGDYLDEQDRERDDFPAGNAE
jgi:gamma-glutamylcyclotransferase (GGCT)/AIG2-like uncharacterized protein YtfP